MYMLKRNKITTCSTLVNAHEARTEEIYDTRLAFEDEF